MNLAKSSKIDEHLVNIIHEGTQQHRSSFDLSVAEIHSFASPGSLDFGGSEFESATTMPVKPKKRNQGDDYGWWNLEEGHYKAIFNEQITDNEDILVIISPHRHASEAGIIAGTNVITGETDTGKLALNFRVPSVGCKIKENARFATLHIMEV
ncbi:hypothetical protein NC796_15735 [Aliifodinibius sp. S!AR15-10]|uniref:hypothetical protein n=1 Tax=Aliifodinibius sp. S!AR15-10 TaxID=2950437 RepID=UPI0028578BF9|nr:hypothetical protein [Aliifodinibius sp. S!AR15-10]MDR8392607.1 hypothetical protein [Aliifodinibius sp. S!AR15-10]